VNAATSLLGGSVAVVAPGFVVRILGTGNGALVRAVGVALIGFSIAVVTIAGARLTRLVRATPLIVAGDVGWVIASIIVITLSGLTRTGVALALALAAAVGTFAVLQYQRKRRLGGREDAGEQVPEESPPVEVIHVERRVSAPADVAWLVVTDHDLYGRLAPNLASVHADRGEGMALQRTCTNRSGRSWSETTTRWEEGVRFEVAVRTDGYPYPLQEMRGSWWVEPDADGSCIVGMDFRYQPCRGIRGRAFAALMQILFPLARRRIMRGWEREILRRSSRTG
jgi:hypothetical protein